MKNTIRNILSKLQPQQGITLIEILVAAAITVIVTAAAMGVYITQHTGYLWQEQLSEVNLNAQFAMDEFTKRITDAGYGMPTTAVLFIPTVTDTETVLSIMGSNANPDTLNIISKSPVHGNYGLLQFGIGSDSTFLCCVGVSDTLPWDGLDTYDSIALMAGDYALIADWATNNAEIFQVSRVQQPEPLGTWIRRTFNFRGYIGSSYVTKVEFYQYYLDPTTNNLMLITRSDPETSVVVANIDSLNFTYISHVWNGDRTLDVPARNVPVKAVNVRLTVRTARMKKDVYGNPNMRLCSDSLQADSMGCGGYGFKTLNSTIKIRNQGFRAPWY